MAKGNLPKSCLKMSVKLVSYAKNHLQNGRQNNCKSIFMILNSFWTTTTSQQQPYILVVIACVERSLLGPINSGRCRQVVAIGRRSSAQMWLYYDFSHIFIFSHFWMSLNTSTLIYQNMLFPFLRFFIFSLLVFPMLPHLTD